MSETLDYSDLHWAKAAGDDVTAWFLYCLSEHLNALGSEEAQAYVEKLVCEYEDGKRYVPWLRVEDELYGFLELQTNDGGARTTRFARAVLSEVDHEQITEFLLKACHAAERIEAEPDICITDLVNDLMAVGYDGHLRAITPSGTEAASSG